MTSEKIDRVFRTAKKLIGENHERASTWEISEACKLDIKETAKILMYLESKDLIFRYLESNSDAAAPTRWFWTLESDFPLR
ncbi:MAG: hypothetical protein HXS54_06190 [Theionarchaea archaeon]|nr:hypothetical protein [Theionarchaea archaeon]